MNEEKFEYTYSALTEEERSEAERIRNQYLKREQSPDKLSELRKLDNKVKNIPTVAGLILGVLGTLIFGLGLTMILEWALPIWGIILGAIGVAVAALAYFIYEKARAYLMEKYSKDILKLSDEILGEPENDK